MRHLSPLPRRPGGGMWPSRTVGSRWSIQDFGAAFILRAPLLTDPLVGNVRGTLTLSGSDIVSAVDSAGGALVLERVEPGRECTLDETVPFAGRAAIRTSRTNATLRTMVGGVNAPNAPHYMAAMARAVAVADNASNFATFILYGQPVGTNSGIGSQTPPDAFAWSGNAVTGDSLAPFDTDLHYFELSYDGVERRVYLDGRLVAKRDVSMTFNGPEGAGFGLLSWYEFMRAIQDMRIYAAAWLNAAAQYASRMNLAMALGEGVHTVPLRIDGKGDSRTFGTGSTAGNDYLTQLGELFSASARPVTIANHGLSGYRSNQIREALCVRDVGELHSPFGVNVSVLWPGYNSINQLATEPTSAEAMYADLCTMIDFEREYGNKVFVMTVPTSLSFESTPAQRAMQLAYNALVMANSWRADGVIDIAPYFEPYNGADYTDTLHFTDASQLLIAEVVYDYLTTRV